MQVTLDQFQIKKLMAEAAQQIKGTVGAALLQLEVAEDGSLAPWPTSFYTQRKFCTKGASQFNDKGINENYGVDIWNEGFARKNYRITQQVEEQALCRIGEPHTREWAGHIEYFCGVLYAWPGIPKITIMAIDCPRVVRNVHYLPKHDCVTFTLK